jgi:hypothetical protein
MAYALLYRQDESGLKPNRNQTVADSTAIRSLSLKVQFSEEQFSLE